MGYKQYFVYLLTNPRKTVLYTGITNDIQHRVWEHKHKLLPGFTKKYNCDRLVYFEIFTEVTQAIAREKQIKGWIRAKKNALVNSHNPEWNDLSASGSANLARGPSPSLRLRSGQATRLRMTPRKTAARNNAEE